MFHVPNKYRIRSVKKHPMLASDDSYGNNGLFVFDHGAVIVNCIASDGEGWEYVSVTLNVKMNPPWEIMNHVKNLFWDKEDCIVQYHPPESQYVNNHPYCLHLWRKIGYDFPIPESILVGVK